MNESTIGLAVERGFFSCENNVFLLPLPTIEKLTYLALTRYAGSNNRAWPSYNTLARDVTCGRKRAIQAVKRLEECKLVEKMVRPNRSNVYLVYPPEYYSAQNEPAPGVDRTPQEDTGVSPEHQGGVERTPGGCPVDTTPVSSGHPKINNKKNNDHQHLKGQPGPGHGTEKREDFNLKEEKAINPDAREKQKNEKREKLRDERQDPPRQPVTREMIESVHAAFKSKGFQATDNAIRQLLKDYGETAVKAAINQTDFKVARNPMAVINWMLATESYVVPAGKEPTSSDPEERTTGPTPKELFEIKKMISETRVNLLKKRTAQPV